MTSESSKTPPTQPLSGTSGISNSSSWKLPVGIEDHIEDGIIKMTAGVLAGGTIGMLLFRSGGGWRSMSIASGLGVAIGSSYVRFISSMNNKSVSSYSSISNQMTTKNDIPVQLSPVTPPFDTKSVPAVGGINNQQSRS